MIAVTDQSSYLLVEFWHFTCFCLINQRIFRRKKYIFPDYRVQLSKRVQGVFLFSSFLHRKINHFGWEMREKIHEFLEDDSLSAKNTENSLPSDINVERSEALNPSRKRMRKRKRKRKPTVSITSNSHGSMLDNFFQRSRVKPLMSKEFRANGAGEQNIEREPQGNQISRSPNVQEPAINFPVRNQTIQEHPRSAKAVRGNLKAKAKALSQSRKDLPIWSHSSEIREGLREKDFMLLVGETGSGKSTQVPQILLQELWCKSKSITTTISGITQTVNVGGCIAVTEPRRVAAISLARRVAEEMGTPLGSSSPASKVGYSVRFDNSTSPSTQVKFLTEGMLLQEMLRDPWLRHYSAVIVDEVHERGVNVDLLMGFLRNMNAGEKEGRGGIALKVVIMSATLDVESLRR